MSEVQCCTWHTATEVEKQGSGIVCYAFRHAKYRKLWKMCWIPVVVEKVCVCQVHVRMGILTKRNFPCK